MYMCICHVHFCMSVYVWLFVSGCVLLYVWGPCPEQIPYRLSGIYVIIIGYENSIIYATAKLSSKLTWLDYLHLKTLKLKLLLWFSLFCWAFVSMLFDDTVLQLNFGFFSPFFLTQSSQFLPLISFIILLN